MYKSHFFFICAEKKMESKSKCVGVKLILKSEKLKCSPQNQEEKNPTEMI